MYKVQIVGSMVVCECGSAKEAIELAIVMIREGFEVEVISTMTGEVLIQSKDKVYVSSALVYGI